MKRFGLLLFLLLFIILNYNGTNKRDLNEKIFFKGIEKSLIKVKDNLYACKYEASNFEYKIFLSNLKARKLYEMYKQSVVDSLNWKKYNIDPVFGLNYSKATVTEFYPVVNITKQGAVNFCKWLTEKYNDYPQRKYKKVLFRLPTEKEWIRAAKDSLIKTFTTDYPLFIDGKMNCNFNLINQKMIYSRDVNKDELQLKAVEVRTNEKSGRMYAGQYLISDPATETYKWLIPSTSEEGFPVRINEYKPNSLGMYNMFGNVAEMIEENGRTKSGCWKSTGYFLNPYAEDEFNGFSISCPYIGFRYFMEIIEK